MASEGSFSAQGATAGLNDNPTTQAGRGEPSLEDQFRLPVWVYIDGKEGEFREENGKPLIQWFTKGTVSSEPTFRVEVYEPLLGDPRDFRCGLQSQQVQNGSPVLYAIRALDGQFEVGREYSLLAPGPDFVIRDVNKNEVIERIPPLAPGTYGLVAAIGNSETGAQGLAVTYFTVGAD